MDTMAGRDVVVFTDPDGWYGAAFVPSVEDQALTFSGPGRQITDLETGSLWDLAGRAIDGPLKGSQLERVPAKTGFWFSLVASEPGITVFHAPSG